MRKFKIGYLSPDGIQVVEEVVYNEQTATITKEGEWVGLVLTPPRTAMFADVIAKDSNEVTVEYIYDVAKTDNLNRDYVMQNAGTLVFSSDEHSGFKVNIGKIEPMFLPSIGAAVMQYEPKEQSLENGMLVSNTCRYKPTLLGFINQVSVLEA